MMDRLYAVNARAIDLTEALLVLSRAGQRSFIPEPVDLSLIAEEAAETLLPLAEQRGVTIATSGEVTPAVGSHALLLQLATNLVHNAVVHNLPEQGNVWVTTSTQPTNVVLTVENTGPPLSPQLVSTLVEPFVRGSERMADAHHAGVGLGLAIVESITHAHDGSLTLTPPSRWRTLRQRPTSTGATALRQMITDAIAGDIELSAARQQQRRRAAAGRTLRETTAILVLANSPCGMAAESKCFTRRLLKRLLSLFHSSGAEASPGPSTILIRDRSPRWLNRFAGITGTSTSW